MNSVIIYRTNGTGAFGVAFACALAIHAGAVALSANRNEPRPFTCVMPPAIIDVTVDQTEMPPPPVDIPIPDPPTMPDVENEFHDDIKPPLRPARVVPISRVPSPPTVSLSSVKTSAISAPRPDYPYEARRRRETGSGVATLSVDSSSGIVVGVEMEQSIGSEILDESTRRTFRRWRFKAGTASRVRVPITFTLSGASF